MIPFASGADLNRSLQKGSSAHASSPFFLIETFERNFLEIACNPDDTSSSRSDDVMKHIVVAARANITHSLREHVALFPRANELMSSAATPMWWIHKRPAFSLPRTSLPLPPTPRDIRLGMQML